ncbi:retention module-containing protein, partial [Marinomonas profundimaris]
MSDNQTPFATLGSPIGFITKISGSVTVQSIDGQERIVKIGDPIFFGETVVTGNGATVTIAFNDGTEVVIGGDSVVEMTDEIYNTGDSEDLVADSSTEIDALQSAILAGDDPTLVQDAPAAGEEQVEASRVDVSIARNDDASLPTFGSDTESSLPSYGYDTDSGNSAVNTARTISASSSSNGTTVVNAVAGTVSINSITSDNVINSTEAAGTVTVSGTAIGGDIASGDPVVLVINGVTYRTVVGAAGTWTVGVSGSDLAADTEFDVVVSSSNSNGSTVESVGSSIHTVDLEISGRMSISDVTSDDIVSAAEAQTNIAITGIVSGDVKNGDVVTLTVNGKEYTGTVTNRMFSIDVAGSDLAQDPDRRIDATITLTDGAGNTLIVTANSNYQVDITAAGAPGVTIDEDVNDNGYISATELDGDVNVTISLTGTNAVEGDTLTVNGTAIVLTEAQIEAGKVETTVAAPAEGATLTVDATITDAAGNESEKGSDSAKLDTTADADST